MGNTHTHIGIYRINNKSAGQSSTRNYGTDCEEILRCRETPFIDSEESSPRHTPYLQNSQVYLNKYSSSVGQRPITPSKAHYQRPSVGGGLPTTLSVDRYSSTLNAKTTSPRFRDDYHLKYSTNYSSDRKGAGLPLFTNRVADYSSARSNIGNNRTYCNPDTYNYPNNFKYISQFSRNNATNNANSYSNGSKRVGTYFGYNYEYDTTNRSSYPGTHSNNLVNGENKPQKPTNCNETNKTTSGIPSNASKPPVSRNANKDSEGNEQSIPNNGKPSTEPVITEKPQTKPKDDGDKEIKIVKEPPLGKDKDVPLTQSGRPIDENGTPTTQHHDNGETPPPVTGAVGDSKSKIFHDEYKNGTPGKVNPSQTNSDKTVEGVTNMPQKPINSDEANKSPSGISKNVSKTPMNRNDNKDSESNPNNGKPSTIPETTENPEPNPKDDGDKETKKVKEPPVEKDKDVPLTQSGRPIDENGTPTTQHQDNGETPPPVTGVVGDSKSKLIHDGDTNGTPGKINPSQIYSDKAIKGDNEPQKPYSDDTNKTPSGISKNISKTPMNRHDNKDSESNPNNGKPSTVPVTKENPEPKDSDKETKIIKEPPLEKDVPLTKSGPPIEESITPNTQNHDNGGIPPPVTGTVGDSKSKLLPDGGPNRTPEKQTPSRTNSGKTIKGDNEPQKPTTSYESNKTSSGIPENASKTPISRNDIKDSESNPNYGKPSTVPVTTENPEPKPKDSGEKETKIVKEFPIGKEKDVPLTQSGSPFDTNGTPNTQNDANGEIPPNVTEAVGDSKSKLLTDGGSNGTPEKQTPSRTNSGKTIKGDNEPQKPTTSYESNKTSSGIPENASKTPISRNDIKDSESNPNNRKPSTVPVTIENPEPKDNDKETRIGKKPPSGKDKDVPLTQSGPPIEEKITPNPQNHDNGGVPPTVIGAVGDSKSKILHDEETNETPEKQIPARTNSDKIVKGDNEPQKPINSLKTDTPEKGIPENISKTHTKPSAIIDSKEHPNDVKGSTVPVAQEIPKPEHSNRNASPSPVPKAYSGKSLPKLDKGTTTDAPVKNKTSAPSGAGKLITPDANLKTKIPQLIIPNNNDKVQQVPEKVQTTNKPKTEGKQNKPNDNVKVPSGKYQPRLHPSPGIVNVSVPQNSRPTTPNKPNDAIKKGTPQSHIPVPPGKSKNNGPKSNNSEPPKNTRAKQGKPPNNNVAKQVDNAMIVQNYMKLLKRGNKPNFTRMSHNTPKREGPLPKPLQKRAADYFPPSLMKRIMNTPTTPSRNKTRTNRPAVNEAVQKNKKSKPTSLNNYIPPQGHKPYYAPKYSSLTTESVLPKPKKPKEQRHSVPSILSPESQSERQIPYHDVKYVPMKHRKEPYIHQHRKTGHPNKGIPFKPYHPPEEKVIEGAMELAFVDTDEGLVMWESYSITHTEEIPPPSPPNNNNNSDGTVSKVERSKKISKPQISVPSHIVCKKKPPMASTAGLPDLSTLIHPAGLGSIKTEFDKYLEQYKQSIATARNLATLTTTYYKPQYRHYQYGNTSNPPTENSFPPPPLPPSSARDQYCPHSYRDYPSDRDHRPGCFSESDLSSERFDACSSVPSNLSFVPRDNYDADIYSVESEYSNTSGIGDAIESLYIDKNIKNSKSSLYCGALLSNMDLEETENLVAEPGYNISREKEALEQIMEDINGNSINGNTDFDHQYKEFEESLKTLENRHSINLSPEIYLEHTITADVEPVIDYVNSLHDVVSGMHHRFQKFTNSPVKFKSLKPLCPRVVLRDIHKLEKTDIISTTLNNNVEEKVNDIEIVKVDIQVKAEDSPVTDLFRNEKKVNKIEIDTLERSCLLLGCSKPSIRDLNSQISTSDLSQASELDKYIDEVLHRSMNYKSDEENESDYERTECSSVSDIASDVDSDMEWNDLTDKDSDADLELSEQEPKEKPTSFTDSAFRFIMDVTAQCSQFLLPLASHFLNLDAKNNSSVSTSSPALNSQLNETKNVATTSKTTDDTPNDSQKPLVSVLKKSSVYVSEEVHKITHGRSVHFGSPITSDVRILETEPEPEDTESTTNLYFQRRNTFPANGNSSQVELSDDSPFLFNLIKKCSNNPFITMKPSKSTTNIYAPTTTESKTNLNWRFL